MERPKPRFQRPPLHFLGSKYQALKFLKPLWDAVSHDEYREPMVGNGAVFFAKPKSKLNWINDLDKDIATLYRVMKNNVSMKRLINLLKDERPTRSRHVEMRINRPDTDLEIAHKYFFLNRTSYAGIMLKPKFDYSYKSVQVDRWEPMIRESGEKLKDAIITNTDFEEIINEPARGKIGVFMFLDPPYYFASQKHHYGQPFEMRDHFRLMEALKKTEHKFCLTYNNCRQIRDMYSWANITPITWRHNPNIPKVFERAGRELIISNFTPLFSS